MINFEAVLVTGLEVKSLRLCTYENVVRVFGDGVLKKSQIISPRFLHY